MQQKKLFSRYNGPRKEEKEKGTENSFEERIAKK